MSIFVYTQNYYYSDAYKIFAEAIDFIFSNKNTYEKIGNMVKYLKIIKIQFISLITSSEVVIAMKNLVNFSQFYEHSKMQFQTFYTWNSMIS